MKLCSWMRETDPDKQFSYLWKSGICCCSLKVLTYQKLVVFWPFPVILRKAVKWQAHEVKQWQSHSKALVLVRLKLTSLWQMTGSQGRSPCWEAAGGDLPAALWSEPQSLSYSSCRETVLWPTPPREDKSSVTVRGNKWTRSNLNS